MQSSLISFLIMAIISAPYTTLKQDSYIIKIPSVIDTTKQDSFTIEVSENKLSTNQVLNISFQHTFTLTDKHGKRNIEGHILSDDLSIEPNTTNNYNVNFSIDEASAGSYTGNPTITIDVETIQHDYILKNGSYINGVLKNLAPTSITFSHNDLSSETPICNISQYDDAPIYVYQSNKDLIISNNTNEPMKANTDMSYCFNAIGSLVTINNLNILDTSNTTNMSYMFSSTRKLNAINGINNLDVSKVENMSHMFEKSRAITSLNISNWKTSSLKDLSYMFSSCSLSSLQGLDNLISSSVENVESLFRSSVSLTSANIPSSWNSSGVSNFASMFEGCTSLISVDVSNLNLSSATNLSSLFQGDTSLTNITGINNLNLSNVQDISNMFYDDQALSSLNLANWNTSNITNMEGLFDSCSSLTTTGDLSSWNTSNVTNMAKMFKNTNNLTSVGSIANWNINSVINFSNMFNKSGLINTINSLNAWNPSSAKDTSLMFANMAWPDGFKLDLSNWTLNNVETMSEMFLNTSSIGYIKSINISGLNPSSCSNFSGLFMNNDYLEEIIGINNLNVGNANDLSYMFYNCSNLKDMDLANWNVTNVNNLDYCFYGTRNLSSIGDVNNWNLSPSASKNNCFEGGSLIGKNGNYPSWF